MVITIGRARGAVILWSFILEAIRFVNSPTPTRGYQFFPSLSAACGVLAFWIEGKSPVHSGHVYL
jgi:hypothetical protein